MADTTPPAGLLRPLGFGELFDRAVTLYVRNFLPFSGIVLVLLVPLGVLQYFMDAGQSDQWAAIFATIKAGGASAPSTPHLSPVYYLLLAVVLLFGALLLPFALNAVAIGVARIYTGGTVGVRACYAAALRRFWQTIGMIVMQAVIVGSAYGAMAMVVVILFIAGIALLSGSKIGGIIVLIVASAALLAMLTILVVIAMAMGFAMYGVVIEGRGVFDAIGAGFTRIFARAEFWRAVLIALSMGVIYLAGILAASGLEILAQIAHLTILTVLVQTATSTVLYAAGVVLFAVYYYDVRIRREGLDVEAGLQNLVAPTTA